MGLLDFPFSLYRFDLQSFSPEYFSPLTKRGLSLPILAAASPTNASLMLMLWNLVSAL